MIYTIGTMDPGYGLYRTRATWVDVDCESEIDIVLMNELIDQQELITPGLRCICHRWWDCGRAHCADYLMFHGVEIKHLGEICWDHSLYQAARLEKLYDFDTLKDWTRSRHA